MVLALLIGCSAPCPPGTGTDPERSTRIHALAGPAPPLCFGPVPDLGVVEGRRLLLEVRASDEALAARVAHLRHHLEPVERGPGCLDRLRSEEARAWSVEHRLRRRFGLPPLWPLGSAPSFDEVEHWLIRQDDPVARQLAVSHRRRCGTSPATLSPETRPSAGTREEDER